MKETQEDKLLDIEELLHPAQAFNHPSEVVNDPGLTLNEKRAILASWASDACAIEAVPELRAGPVNPVRFDDIMDALRSLDRGANVSPGSARWKLRHRLVRQHGFGRGQGQALQ